MTGRILGRFPSFAKTAKGCGIHAFIVSYLRDRSEALVLLSKRMSILPYLVIAAALLMSELLLGIGLIGMIGGLVGAVVTFASAQSLPIFCRRILIVTVFLCVVLATFTWLSFNIRIAKQNAVPIIKVCEQFRSAHNRYPAALGELSPRLLPSVPPARYTLMAKKFIYDSDPPKLCFVVMFHGLSCYDFQSGSWKTNE